MGAVMLENQKHERFCQVWHETNNKSEAYRDSHPNATKWKDETVHKRASELSKKGFTNQSCRMNSEIGRVRDKRFKEGE